MDLQNMVPFVNEVICCVVHMYFRTILDGL